MSSMGARAEVPLPSTVSQRATDPAYVRAACAALAVCVLLSLGGAFGLPLGPLRPLIGIFAVLLAPGWGLLATLRLGWTSLLRRLVVSFCSSLAVVALSIVALEVTSLRITERASVLAVSLAALALLVPASARYRPSFVRDLPTHVHPPSLAVRRRLRERPLVTAAFAAAVLIPGALILWELPAAQRDVGRPFTALAFAQAPTVGRTGKLSVKLVGATIPIGVTNHEGRTLTYGVAVHDDSGKILSPPVSITLRDGTSYRVARQILVRCNRRVVIDLTRADRPGVYRSIQTSILRTGACAV